MPDMHATIHWLDKVQFVAETGSGHTLMIDGAADSGGTNAGARPMELLLTGLGACAAFDVVTILKKSRQPILNCAARVDAVRADAVPAVFEKIHLHFVLTGAGLDDGRVARAVRLSAEKYCSASIMLGRAGVEITHGYEIHEPDL